MCSTLMDKRLFVALYRYEERFSLELTFEVDKAHRYQQLNKWCQSISQNKYRSPRAE